MYLHIYLRWFGAEEHFDCRWLAEVDVVGNLSFVGCCGGWLLGQLLVGG